MWSAQKIMTVWVAPPNSTLSVFDTTSVSDPMYWEFAAGDSKVIFTGNFGAWRVIRTSVGLNTGKYVFGVSIAESVSNWQVGLMGESYPFGFSNEYLGAGAESFGLTRNRYVDHSYYLYDFQEQTNSPVIGSLDFIFAVDLDNKKLWIGNENGWFSGNPSTGVNPTITWDFSSLVYPAVAALIPTTFTLNSGQADFVLPVPSGFCEGWFG